MNYRNLTVKGLSDLTVCEGAKIRGGPSQRRASLCAPLVTVSVATSSGPGVPFRGRVTAILRRPKVVVTFRDVDGKDLHFRSAHVELTSKVKYVPNYESSIPLNPWSKVSMSGYMVSRCEYEQFCCRTHNCKSDKCCRVKKALPTALDKTLLKLLHVVEKLKL